MKKALEEAYIAQSEGEIPVGAIIVCKDKIIARAHNQTERLNDVTARGNVGDYIGNRFVRRKIFK